MSCYIKTNDRMEVRVSNGSPSYLFEKIRIKLGNDEKALEAYDKIKDLPHTSYDASGEPNFHFGGDQPVIDDLLLTLATAGIDFNDLSKYPREYEKRTGNKLEDNATGFVDVINNLLGYSDSGTLSEEAVHLGTSAIFSHPAVQRLMGMINKESYAELWAKYERVYSNDQQIQKEIMDQLISEHLQEQYQPTRVKGIIKRILNRIKSVFSKPGLKAQIKEVASLITSPDFEYSVNSDFDYIQYHLEDLDHLDEDQRKKLDNFTETIEKFIDDNEKLFSTNYKDQKVTQELRKNINQARNDLAIVNLINHIDKKIFNGKQRLDELVKEMASQENPPLNEIAQQIRELDDVFNAFGDTIKDLRKNNKINDKKLRGELRDILSEFDDYKTEFEQVRRIVVGHSLLPWFKRNPDFQSLDDLDQMFQQAEELGYHEYMLSAMADSGDDFLQVIDQYVKKALDRVEVKSLNEIQKLFKLFRRLKDKSFDRFFQMVDSKLGRYLLDQYDTEQYQESMNLSFTKLRQLFSLDEDPYSKIRRQQFDLSTVHGKDYAKQQLAKFKAGTLEYSLYRKQAGKLVAYTYDEFKQANPKNTKSAFLEATLKAYKAEQAQWFEKNSKLSVDAPRVVENQFKRLVDKVMIGDLAKYKTKVLNHMSKRSVNVGDQEINYFLEDPVTVLAELKLDLLADQQDDIYNMLYTHKNFLDMNIGKKFNSQERYGKYLLSQPNDTYRNYAYDKLSKEDKDFLNYLKELKQKNLSMRTPGELDLVPQMNQGTQERLEGLDPIGLLKTFKDQFTINEDDTDFGDQKNKGLLPIYFRSKLPLEDMSRDLITVFAGYIINANHYLEMDKVQSSLELMTQVVSERDIVNITRDKDNKIADIEETGIKGGKNAEWLTNYIKANIFGIRKADDDVVPKRLVRPISIFQNFISLNSLGLNMFSGVANALTSTMTRYQERIANKLHGGIKKEAYKRADKFYIKHITSSIAAYGKPETVDKFSIMSSYLGIMEDLYADKVANDVGKSRAGRIIKQLPYAPNTIGEHFVAHKTALAKGFSVTLQKNGQDVTLIDALMDSVTDEGEMNFQGYTKDGKPFTILDAKEIGRQINRQNQKLFGIYNEIDKSQAQQYVMGRLVFQFRKFVIPTLYRRFREKEFDYQLGESDEGIYRTTGRFLKQVYNEAKKQNWEILKMTKKEWANLSDEEKMNITRTRVEATTILVATILGGILTQLAEDDEDNEVLAFVAYQANRHYREMSFSINPFSTLEILSSPVAAVNQLQALGNFGKSIDPIGFTFSDDPFFRRYQDGTDELYLTRNALRFVPFYKTGERLLDPVNQFNMTK